MAFLKKHKDRLLGDLFVISKIRCTFALEKFGM